MHRDSKVATTLLSMQKAGWVAQLIQDDVHEQSFVRQPHKSFIPHAIIPKNCYMLRVQMLPLLSWQSSHFIGAHA